MEAAGNGAVLSGRDGYVTEVRKAMDRAMVSVREEVVKVSSASKQLVSYC